MSKTSKIVRVLQATFVTTLFAANVFAQIGTGERNRHRVR